MLHDTEKCYKMIEKVALTLIPLAQRLKPYFPSHQVLVKTNYPIKQVFEKSWTRKKDGGLLHRTFRVWHPVRTTRPHEDAIHDWIFGRIRRKRQTTLDWWILFVDGVSNVKGSGVGTILEGLDNITLEQALKLNFRASNNQANHEALIAGLKLASKVEAKWLRSYIDS